MQPASGCMTSVAVMTDPFANRPSAKAPAPERMALLHTLAFTTMRLCTAQLDAFTQRLTDALAQMSHQADSTETADLALHAYSHLTQHRTTFHRLIADCLQQELLREVETAGERVASRRDSGAMDLSLLTFDAMERKVLIDNLSQALDVANADLLAVLNLRIAHWLQTDEIGAADNPFRSEVFLRAVSDAWSKFDLRGASHLLVLRQLRVDVFLQIEPILQALNRELAIRKVLPDAEDTYRHRKVVQPAVPLPSRQDILRQWLAPEGSLNVIGARAGALLKKVFAHLQRNETIPPHIRELLTRLQPALRVVALAGLAFFLDERHPARRLLETLLRAGLGSSAGDALHDTVESAVAPILADGELPASLFEDAVRALEARMADEDHKLADRLGALAADAIAQENITHVQRLAEQDVAARIEVGDAAAFIEAFLQAQWTRVLSFAYEVRETRPEVLPDVRRAMDDLIDSVQPKSSPEERKHLIDSLPALLSMLNTGLDFVKWEGQERVAFFATLAEQHAAAIRAPVQQTPRAQLGARMDAMQKASENDLRRRAREQQDAARAVFMREVEALTPGTWAEFVRNDGSRTNCKLIWISPRRNRFIFSGRQGQLLFTLDEDALANALRAERVAVIPAGRIAERAIAASLDELRAG